jgi:hypothetical protein
VLKKLWLPLSLLSVLLLISIVGARAHAFSQFRTGQNTTVAAGQTVDSTMFVDGRDINIAGTVNGDVFCGGQTINISGTIKGDVICGGQTINISGNVDGNVRVGAQTVNLSGTISKNATIAAQTLNTDSKSKITGDASFAGTDMNLNGQIGRDLNAGGNNVNIGGQIGRDVKSGANKISLAAGAKVGGSIEYTSKDQISLANGAMIGGKVTHNQPKQHNGPWIRLAFFGNWFALVMALLLLITALIVTALLPQLVHAVGMRGIARPWMALLTGFIAGIVAPIALILLSVTVIGIPLAILLFFAWLVIALSSGLFTAYWLGLLIWRTSPNAILTVLAGGVLLLILMLIPYLGFFVMLIAFWLGSGMVLLTLKDKYRRPHYKLSPAARKS